MDNAQAIFATVSKLIIHGKTNKYIAAALNEQGFRTPSTGRLWTAPNLMHYRFRNQAAFEWAENERLRQEWAFVPMPRYPSPNKAEMLAGVPFLDTGFDGELDIPVLDMRRTR